MPGAVITCGQPSFGDGHSTPFAKPCPRGPVETSTPTVRPRSGCPGVFAAEPPEALQLVQREVVTGKMQQATRAASIRDLRKGRTDPGLNQPGIPRVVFQEAYPQSVYAMAAAPMGMPGCPEDPHSCTASAERIRIVLMHKSSSVLEIRVIIKSTQPTIGNACAKLFKLDAYASFRSRDYRFYSSATLLSNLGLQMLSLAA